MSSTPIIGAAVLVFIVAAMFYYQNQTVEKFDSGVKNMMNSWATWDPKDPPIAGRSYDPRKAMGPFPFDLNRSPVSKPGAFPPGALPTSADNKPANVPGMPPSARHTLATAKEMSELDSKIMTWLAAASQREREKPGSLTSQQLEYRIILQARLEDIRNQLGLNNITDSYVTVANEIMTLRRDIAAWQHQAPFISAAYDFGKGTNPDTLLTKVQYDAFFEIFSQAIKEFKDLYQPEPLQKVRYQQLQVIRQSLIDSSSPTNPPPIKMGAAQLFLRQMVRPDQPLPTLLSIPVPGAGSGSGSRSGSGSVAGFTSGPASPLQDFDSNPADVMEYLQNIQWKLAMTYNPIEQEITRAAASLMDRLRTGGISASDARTVAANIDARLQPLPGYSVEPFSNNGSNDIIDGANIMCSRIRKAMPRDAKALGCRHVSTKFDAATVINTVCDRIYTSAPHITPEQFNCPALKRLIKSDGVANR